jgi:hypothetical protein
MQSEKEENVGNNIPSPLKIIDMSRPADHKAILKIYGDDSESKHSKLEQLVQDHSAVGSSDNDEEEEEMRRWEISQIRRGGALNDHSEAVDQAVYEIAHEEVLKSTNEDCLKCRGSFFVDRIRNHLCLLTFSSSGKVPNFPPIPSPLQAINEVRGVIGSLKKSIETDELSIKDLTLQIQKLGQDELDSETEIAQLERRHKYIRDLGGFFNDFSKWITSCDSKIEELELRWLDPWDSWEDDVGEKRVSSMESMSKASLQILHSGSPDFRDLSQLLSRLVHFKESFPEEYRQTQMWQGALQVTAPHVRLSLLTWDPLGAHEVQNEVGLEHCKWHTVVRAYGTSEAKPLNPNDPDLNLLYRVFIDVVLPVFASRVHISNLTVQDQQGRLLAVLEEILYVVSKSDAPFQVCSTV